MKNLRTFFLLVAFSCSFSIVYSQIPGFIYKQSGNAAIRAVLDPNGDGFISTSSTGFVGTDYGEQSELKMIPLPIVGVEPAGDVSTGGSGGHTDIVSSTNPSNQAVYVLYKKVGGTYYLIFRFRLGGASTASKGYSVLFDTDGIFGGQYPGSPKNPGFEKEVVLQTGSGGVVAIYNHNNLGATLAATFPIDEYSQRSIALTTVDGNADYFYDFCVPYPSLDLSYDPVRTVSVSITSANSGLVGTKADFNGINDKLYGNDPDALANVLIASSPSYSLTNLVEGYVFPLVKSTKPSITMPIRANATTISGTSTEDNGATIKVYNGNTLIGTTTVSGNVWTLSGVSGLVMGDNITATATAPNKSLSDQSSTVTVEKATTCYTARPVITSYVNGQTKLIVNWTNPTGSAIASNSVQIKIYDVQTGTPVLFSNVLPNPSYIVAGSPNSSGSVTIDLRGINQTEFGNGRYYATATVGGCESAFSEPYSATNYTLPSPPIINTSSILASPSIARSVNVSNAHTSPATINLYIEGVKDPIATASNVAVGTSTNFSYTGFTTGDTIVARVLVNGILSNRSNFVVVEASNVQATIPNISGAYNTSSTVVSGTSSESSGSVVYLYANGSQIGSATVNAGGTWSISGLNLTARNGQSLTAKVKPADKLLSNASSSVTISLVISAPSLNGSIIENATTISGTGGNGTIKVYIDDAEIGTATPIGGNWSLTNIPLGQLYKGAKVTATNFVSGVESAPSSMVMVSGVDNFIITTIGGSYTLPNVQAGVPFDIKITARDGSNATYTAFTGTVSVSSSSNFLTGGGISNAFTAGELNPYNLTLTTAGSHVIRVMNTQNPSVYTTANISVTGNTMNKLILNAPIDITPGLTRATYTVTLADYFGNSVNAASPVIINLSSNSGNGQFYNAISAGSVITSVTIPAGSNSATVYFNASAAGTYTVTAASGALTSASDQIVAGFIWQGDISTDWGTAGNWEGNVVPTIYDEVIIANKVTYWPALDQNRTFKDLQIASNATLDLNGYTLTVTGVLSGTGKFIGGGTSSLIFTGTGSIGTVYFDQSIDGTTNKLQSLTINRTGSGVLILGGNIRVGTVMLTEGIIDLDDANLYLTGTAVGKSSSYFKTSGTGLVKKSIAQNTSFLFPVGNAMYNPVKVTNNTNVANEEFGAQVIDEVFQDGNGRGNPNKVVNSRVVRTWEITKTSPGPATGAGVNLEFYWNDGEILGTTNVNNLSVYHYGRGSGWGKQSGAHTRDAANKKVGYTGYTGSFSPFSLQDDTGNLPVVWGNFIAKYQNGGVVLNWITLTEIDSKEFLVHHSEDGVQWNIISTIPAKGNSRLSNAYSFIHNYPSAGVNYYRIVEKSFTEALQYSSIVSVNVPVEGALILYGNPVSNGSLKFNLPKANLVSIIDLQGKLIFEEHRQAGINKIEVTSISKGTYILRSGQESIKFIVQ